MPMSEGGGDDEGAIAALESGIVTDDGPEREKHKRSRVAYWIMTLLGAGLLLPWNAIISVVDYFKVVYPGFAIEFYLGMFYIWPQLPVLAVMVRYGDRISFTIRIVVCFVIESLVLAFIPLMASVLKEEQEVSKFVTLGIVFIAGLGTAVLQSSLFGFASQFPPIYNQAIMAGQGVAGVGVCLMRIVTKVAVPDVTASATLYFALGCGILVSCTVCYFWLLRLPFTQYHLEKHRGSVAAAKRDRSTANKASRASKEATLGASARAGDEAGDEVTALLADPGTASVNGHVPNGHGGRSVGTPDGPSASEVYPAPSGSPAPSVGSNDSGFGGAAGQRTTRGPVTSGGQGGMASLTRGMTLRWLADKKTGIKITTPLLDGHHHHHRHHHALAKAGASSLEGRTGEAARPDGGEGGADAGAHVARDDDAESVSSTDSDGNEGTCTRYTRVFRGIWKYALAETLIFLMTFSVFPGEITLIPYKGSMHFLDGLHLNNEWWAIILITWFNCFDLVGRSSAGMCTLFSERVILLPALARFGLIALFVFCVYSASAVFNDVFALVMVSVFAISNGYIASVGMMYAPSKVAPHDRELAGFLMSLFLQLGIFVGAQSALLVKKLR